MKATLFICIVAAVSSTASCLAASSADSHGSGKKFVEFNAPGAGTTANQGTLPQVNNDRGDVAGYFLDAHNIGHGFLRYHDGRIKTFHVAGKGNLGTYPEGINCEGVVVGNYVDAKGVSHGFKRAVDGTIQTFDYPGADVQFTVPWAINASGVIVGYYLDAHLGFHGFVRSRSGAYTTVDAPPADSGSNNYSGTFAYNITDDGIVEGQAYDAKGVSHGFLRLLDGSIKVFNAPSAGTVNQLGTYTAIEHGINNHLLITGEFADASNTYHGYIRDRENQYVVFDAPGQGSGSYLGSYPAAINDEGTVAGFVYDPSGVARGFIRSPEGFISLIDAPHAGTADNQGTFAYTINDPGQIAGFYYDHANVVHGFLLETKEGW